HGFVDLAGLLLLRLIDLVEGAFDLIRGRGHTLHLHGFYAEAGLVQVEQVLHFELHLLGNFGPALGEDLGHGVIPHPRSHDDLSHIAQRQRWIAIAEEIFHRINNAVLHNPGDLRDVEVASEHQRLIQERALTKARAHARLFSAEAKLLFSDALHFDGTLSFYAHGQFPAQPWFFPAHVLPEALHDSYFISLDCIEHGQEQNGTDKHEHPNDNDASRQAG